MSQVTVVRADNASSLESLNNITNAIRNRAAQLAQSSGGTNQGGMNQNGASQGGANQSGANQGGTNQNGSSDATRNWLQAERDLFCVPASTLTENDQQFSITVAAAGCDSGNLEVIATSNVLIVRSSTNNTMAANGQGNIVFSDMDSRALYRRFDLSSSIDTSQVTASLDNGMLTIAAQKAGAGTRRTTAARA
jgi:HSP20 family molecular chaperone IbpA